VTTEIARQIFKQISMGCAYFNIVTDNLTKRSEYILEDANDTFYQYLGLDLEMDIHTNGLQLPDSLSDNPNWLTFLTTLNQWDYNVPFITSIEHKTFQITGFQPDNTSLFLIMDDITNALPQTKHENKMIELLSRYSEVFFENTQDGLFLLEFDGGIFRYLKSNKAHEEMTGVSSLLLKGKTPVEVLGEKDGGFLEKSYQTCISSGKSMMYEETTYVKGIQKSWLVRLTPIKNQDKITYLFGSRIDITELKDLKKDKEKLLKNLNSMFTEHSAVMLITDMKTGKILDANPPACLFYGYTKDEILSLTLEDINEMRQDAICKEHRYFLYCHRLKSGETKMVDVYSCPITYEGKPQLFSIIFDVSDREKFRDDLYLEKVLLKVTLNSIGDGVVTTNMEGKITYLNQMAQNISGWNQEEAYLKPFEEIFDLRNAANGKIISNPIKKVLKTGKTIELADNTVLLNKQGDLIPIADSAASIRDDTGHGYGVVMVFRDVTQTKKQQQRILYLSYHDPLTEIYNRRFQEEKMVKLNKESMLPLTIIMGDVNGLKVINDVFGHKTGDRLLKEVAKIMQFTIKKKGIAARWGGDEFLILMPKTNVEEAQDMIQTLEKSFETNNFLPLQISVSLGFDVRQSMNEPMHQSLQKAEEQMYHKKLLAGQSYRNSIINTLLATLYEKSMETEEHALRLETYCIAIAEKMGLAPEEKNELSLLAMLHDIGKVGINMAILKKPGPLNEEEWKEMRRHPEIGYRIAQNTPELSTVAEYILSHHERWDGSGYPRGLKGTDIPLLCRILAVADSYDAMTNNRAYRKAMDSQIAMEEIKRCQGTQFDPEIVEIFLGLNQIY
jgi:diguanylate cyclase (GGDEF)-like protein/PAS domain S-box-containing protein